MYVMTSLSTRWQHPEVVGSKGRGQAEERENVEKGGQKDVLSHVKRSVFISLSSADGVREEKDTLTSTSK